MSLFDLPLVPPEQDDLITADSTDPFVQAKNTIPSAWHLLCYCLLSMDYVILWVNIPHNGATRRSRVRVYGLFWSWMIPLYRLVSGRTLSWAAPTQLWASTRWTPWGNPVPPWSWPDRLLWAYTVLLSAWYVYRNQWGILILTLLSTYIGASVIPRGLRVLCYFLDQRKGSP